MRVQWMTKAAGVILTVMATAGTLACEEAFAPDEDAAFAAEGQGQLFRQVDRFGLPAVATVFIPSAKRDAYNRAAPHNDRADFFADVFGGLRAFGNTEAQAEALARALLPDVQPIDAATPSGFLNGRRPQDDVITAELGLIFGGNAALNDDHVDANDRPFLGAFPYLADPTVQ